MVLGMSGGAKPTYLHDGELSRSPPDETFIHMLQQNCCLTGPHFPPPAIVEALHDYVTHYYKVRRLHLIVVDLWRPWKYNTARAKEITDQLWYISHCADTHRVSPFRPDGPEPPLRCRRFAYGYALDGSECPSYLVWPQRTGIHMFYWTPPQTTLGFKSFFAHWVWNISIIHSHWSLRSVSVRKLCACLACEKMNFCQTCILPEMGCCVLGLVPIKNIKTTTGLKSRQL